MIQLLWGILNLVLVAFFLVSISKVYKILSDKIGKPLSVVFLFGLFSFGFSSVINQNEGAITWVNPIESVVTDKKPTKILIEKNLLNKIELEYYKGKDSTGKVIFSKAHIMTSGLNFFVKSRVNSFNLSEYPLASMDEPSKSVDGPHYSAYLTQSWYLLGFKALNQNYSLTGPLE